MANFEFTLDSNSEKIREMELRSASDLIRVLELEGVVAIDRTRIRDVEEEVKANVARVLDAPWICLIMLPLTLALEGRPRSATIQAVDEATAESSDVIRETDVLDCPSEAVTLVLVGLIERLVILMRENDPIRELIAPASLATDVCEVVAETHILDDD